MIWLVNLKNEAYEWCTEPGRAWRPRVALLLFGVYILVRIAEKSPAWTIFSPLTLGIHELGHLVFQIGGELVSIAGGSIAQLLAPVFASWQFLKQRDYFAAAFGLVWLGDSLNNLGTYVADARAMELPLVSPFGGDEIIHDWHYLLDRFHLLRLDTALGWLLKMAGIVSVFCFLAAGAWMILEIRKTARENT